MTILILKVGISESIQSELEKKGHRLKMYEDFDLFFGGAQFIVVDWDKHIFYGTADKRRGGNCSWILRSDYIVLGVIILTSVVLDSARYGKAAS